MKKLFIALVVSTLSLAHADVVLSNIGDTWNNGRLFDADRQAMAGLGFMTGSEGGTIDALSFSLLALNTPSPYPTITFSVYLYTLNAAHTPTTLLGTQDGLSATFSGTLPFIQQTFSYSLADLGGLNAIGLSPNTEYALVLGNNNANDQYYWAGKSSSSYTLNNGYSLVCTVNRINGSAWGVNTAPTENYITEISITPVPEPATAALVAIGMACLFIQSRKSIMGRD